jgi:hypothetical protein
MKKAALSLAAIEGRLVIPANSVRLSSLPKIVYEFHKFPAKYPGLLDLDNFLTVNTASGSRRDDLNRAQETGFSGFSAAILFDIWCAISVVCLFTEWHLRPYSETQSS